MNQRERRAAIVNILANNGQQTAEIFAEHFEVSVRTVYRDVAGLRADGVPVVGEPGQGLSLDVESPLPSLQLSIAEAMSLAAVARCGLERSPHTHSVVVGAARAVEVIEAALPDGLRPGGW